MNSIIIIFIGTANNVKDANENNGEDNPVSPAISYFIVFEECSDTTTESIFAILHDADLDTTVTKLRTRSQQQDGSMKYLASLKQCLKVNVP